MKGRGWSGLAELRKSLERGEVEWVKVDEGVDFWRGLRLGLERGEVGFEKGQGWVWREGEFGFREG